MNLNEGYADSTAFLHRKNAGQLYFSKISSVNFSRFARVFHFTADKTNNELFNLDQPKLAVKQILIIIHYESVRTFFSSE